jgi:nicotinamidase-related amidase
MHPSSADAPDLAGRVTGTVPYPWPYDGCLDPTSVVLVVCGAQSALAQVSHDVPGVLGRLAEVADAVRRGGGHVVWVRYGRRVGVPTSRPLLTPERGDRSWELIGRPAPADWAIDASGWDASFETDLDGLLRSLGTSEVVLGGLAAEVTVDSTVRTLNDRGWECLVLTDGCAPIDPELGRRAHASLTMSGGIFGALGDAAALITALSTSTTGTVAETASTASPTRPSTSLQELP